MRKDEDLNFKWAVLWATINLSAAYARIERIRGLPFSYHLNAGLLPRTKREAELLSLELEGRIRDGEPITQKEIKWLSGGQKINRGRPKDPNKFLRDREIAKEVLRQSDQNRLNIYRNSASYHDFSACDAIAKANREIGVSPRGYDGVKALLSPSIKYLYSIGKSRSDEIIKRLGEHNINISKDEVIDRFCAYQNHGNHFDSEEVIFDAVLEEFFRIP